MPDFVQDLLNVGVTAPQLEPLFRGAEAYVQTWERCEAKKNPFGR